MTSKLTTKVKSKSDSKNTNGPMRRVVGQLTFDEMVLLDIYYVENWNLLLDAGILLRSIPAVLYGRGAY